VSDHPEVRGSHAPGGVAQARRALVAWVDQAGDAGRVFLQARLRAVGGGRYEVRHRRDVHRSLQSLEWVSRDPFFAREIAQTTNRGDHRPLKTSPNLKQGWALVELDAAGLWTALEYLYPAAAVHWHAGLNGTLRPTHWRETAGRQSGLYSSVRLLNDDAVRNTVRACCADAVCLRRVAWGIDAETPLALADEGPVEGDAVVPCPEACSMFISFARQVLKLERAPRREVPGLVPLGADELVQVREVIAAAATGEVAQAREGEFEDPNNLRRIRYLATRLADASAEDAEEADGLPCEGCPKKVPCAGCPLTEQVAA
jgi:4Fe-4S iron-sulfur cluster binding domain/DR2241 stabilising domain